MFSSPPGHSNHESDTEIKQWTKSTITVSNLNSTEAIMQKNWVLCLYFTRHCMLSPKIQLAKITAYTFNAFWNQIMFKIARHCEISKYSDRLNAWRLNGSISNRRRGVSPRYGVETGFRAHSLSLSVGTGALSPRKLGRMAYQPLSLTPLVKNTWRYTSIPQCLHGVVIGNITDNITCPSVKQK